MHEHNQRPRKRARHRDHSVNPSNTNQHRNQLENLFNGLFSNFGLHFPSNNISVISHGGFHGSSPYVIRVYSHDFADDIFDPMFHGFGSNLNAFFRNNFSSNFRSNMSNTILNYIINIIQRNAEEAEKNKHPPTKKEALNKLKKFPMSDKCCKKNGKQRTQI